VAESEETQDFEIERVNVAITAVSVCLTVSTTTGKLLALTMPRQTANTLRQELEAASVPPWPLPGLRTG